MATGLGYQSYAAARAYSKMLLASLVYPTDLPVGTYTEPTVPVLGAWTQIPFTAEGITDERKFILDPTLVGSPAYSTQYLQSILPGGQLSLGGHYVGLDNLLACALGMERLRTTAALESPDWIASVHGTATGALTTLTGCAGTTLKLSTAALTAPGADWVGSYARIQDLTSGGLMDQIRRITAWTDTATATIAAAWTNDPGNSKAVSVGSVWKHTYQTSKNMHIEQMVDVDPLNYLATAAATQAMSRMFYLKVFKGVDEWSFIAVMCNSITFKLNSDGLKITMELIPFRILTAASAFTPNFIPTTIIAEANYVDKINFSDAAFWLDTYSTSVPLTSADAVGISEFELTIKHSLQSDLLTTASPVRRAEPMVEGFREVTGSFTIPRYNTNARLTQYTDGTDLMAKLDLTGRQLHSAASASYEEMIFWLRRIRLTKPDTNVSGPGVVPEKHTFRCLAPSGTEAPSGMPAYYITNPEVQIQTVNQNPFNAFSGQQSASDE